MTNQTSFQSLVDQTKKIAAQFPHHYTKQNRMLDTVEEVGELAQAILMVEKIKTSNDPAKQRTVDDIADALCDVLYNLILLSRDYNIDYATEYQSMLTRLQSRLDKGEFGRKK